MRQIKIGVELELKKCVVNTIILKLDSGGKERDIARLGERKRERERERKRERERGRERDFTRNSGFAIADISS